MARIRTIKPEFWGDTKIGKLSFAARLLFIGLWSYADDWGRGNYKPKEIEGFIFPDDDVDIRALLQELIDADRIVVYESGDQRYFFIPNFDKHQPMRDRSQTRIPAPSEEILENSGKSQEIPGNTTLGSRKLEVGSRKEESVAREPLSKKVHLDAGRLCQVLADLVAANGSRRPEVSESWLRDMDRLIRLDKRSVEDIEALIRWSQADSFWRANILSVKKLRDQFDRLRLQAERQNALTPRQLSPMTTPNPSMTTPEPLHVVALREWIAKAMMEQGHFPTYLAALKDVNTWTVERLEAERERWIA